jgi:hypothetical protein
MADGSKLRHRGAVIAVAIRADGSHLFGQALRYFTELVG